MNEQKFIKLTKLVYSILISVLTVLLGVLTIIQIVDIFNTGRQTGEQMYTQEIILEHFKNIAFVFVLWIILLIAGYVLYLIFPSKEKSMAVLSNKELVEKMSTGLNKDTSLYENEYQKLKKLRSIRLIVGISSIVICLGLLIPPTISLFNNSFYVGESADELMNEAAVIVLNILPFVLSIMAILFIYKVVENITYKKELAIIKSILTSPSNKKPFEIIRPKSLLSDMGINIIRVSILCVAVVCLITGIINGGARDVLLKAIAICTECIGLG